MGCVELHGSIRTDVPLHITLDNWPSCFFCPPSHKYLMWVGLQRTDCHVVEQIHPVPSIPGQTHGAAVITLLSVGPWTRSTRSAHLPRPGWRSLIFELDGDAIRRTGQFFGSDQLVKVFHLQPGLIIAVWRVRRDKMRGMGTRCFIIDRYDPEVQAKITVPFICKSIRIFLEASACAVLAFNSRGLIYQNVCRMLPKCVHTNFRCTQANWYFPVVHANRHTIRTLSVVHSQCDCTCTAKLIYTNTLNAS